MGLAKTLLTSLVLQTQIFYGTAYVLYKLSIATALFPVVLATDPAQLQKLNTLVIVDILFQAVLLLEIVAHAITYRSLYLRSRFVPSVIISLLATLVLSILNIVECANAQIPSSVATYQVSVSQVDGSL